MKKIKVSKELCISCGACVAIDEEHFDFDDSGKSNVKSNNNLDSNSLTNAIEACPTSAISIIEDNDNDANDEHQTDECNCDGCDCNHEGSCHNNIN